MLLNPFMRCKCGKIHVTTLIGPASVCTCGRFLESGAWAVNLLRHDSRLPQLLDFPARTYRFGAN